MSQQTKSFRLGGGLDLVTPAIEKDPGALIAVLNYEPVPDGYRRIAGYERIDGHTDPSQASYWVLDFDAGSVAVAEGDTVDGLTSRATGVALIAGVVESGSYGAGTAAGYLVLTNVDGTFADNEELQVSGATRCTANGTAVEEGADTDANNTTWSRDAVTTARAAISTVPGAGQILGAYWYMGEAYAVRETTDGTASKLWRSSVTGWVEVDLGKSVAYTSGGTTEIEEEMIVVGATSGAYATVKRVVLDDGAWADGDAAGRLILYDQVGTFQAENLDIRDGAANVATIAGDTTAATLPAGGQYAWRTHNFFGSSGTKRMYVANGVSTGFECDGATFVAIPTGMDQDKPTRVACHQDHLFFGFDGGSLQHSGIGQPYSWTVVTGASELGLGDEISDLIEEAPGGVMCVLGLNKTGVLYGSSSADWDFQKAPGEAGAIPWTGQLLQTPVFFDALGFRALPAVQSYGDFEATTLSRLIKPLLALKERNGALPTVSLRVKSKNQYRLFFDDETCIIVDLSGNRPAFSMVDYGFVVRCATSAEDTDGTEVLLVGGDDGYVYRLDRGTSFDGSAVTAYIRLAFYHLGSPTQIKRFHKATIETTAEPDTDLFVNADYSYGNPDATSAVEQEFDISGAGGFWDEANWNEFYWDAQIVGTAEARIPGRGTNVSLAISSELTWAEPHTIHGVTLHFSPRALRR